MVDFINSIVVLLNFVIIPGLSYGSQLALGALGVTFVYAILRFANFAHGELMSFGAMITILFTWFFHYQNRCFLKIVHVIRVRSPFLNSSIF